MKCEVNSQKDASHSEEDQVQFCRPLYWSYFRYCVLNVVFLNLVNSVRFLSEICLLTPPPTPIRAISSAGKHTESSHSAACLETITGYERICGSWHQSIPGIRRGLGQSPLDSLLPKTSQPGKEGYFG